MRRERNNGVPSQAVEFVAPTWQVKLSESEWLGKHYTVLAGFDENGNRVQAQFDWVIEEEEEKAHVFFHECQAKEWENDERFPLLKIINKEGGTFRRDTY
jgi:hypothetical protein